MVHIFTKENFNEYSIEDSVVSGYASVFGVKDNHGDIVQKGAFKESIEQFKVGKSIPILWQHKQDHPIGSIDHMEEDEYGLYISAKILTSIPTGNEAWQLIKSQVICGFSIGYVASNEFLDFELDARVLNKIDLWEVSVVTFPANEETLITAVS